jgi:hypothetical protein
MYSRLPDDSPSARRTTEIWQVRFDSSIATPRPDARQDLFLRNPLAVTPHQERQNVEGFRGEGNRLPIAKDEALLGIYFEATKTVSNHYAEPPPSQRITSDVST